MVRLAVSVHPFAAAIDSVTTEYERGRPGYPEAAISWLMDKLGVEAGTRVLDIYSGTGRLTRHLVNTGASVMALAGTESAREHIEGDLPQVEVVGGAAEAIPLDDESVDATTVAQAFHWFRADEALAEIHRVLVRGGGLGVTYNRRDEADPMQIALGRLLAPLAAGYTWREGAWRGAIAATPLFTAGEATSIAFEQRLDADTLVAHAMSVGFVACASDEDKAHVERELRQLVADAGGRVTLRYENVSLVCFRKEPAEQAVANAARRA